jgi:hypothetical protein
MARSTTEGTTNIRPSRVAGIVQELDVAVNAAGKKRPQLRTGLQDRLQGDPILLDERLGAVVLVPIRPKRENFLDGQDKKRRLSVTIRSVLCTPSSYRLDAKASRGRARFFVARWADSQELLASTGPASKVSLMPPACLLDRLCLFGLLQRATWKKEETSSSFQAVGHSS